MKKFFLFSIPLLFLVSCVNKQYYSGDELEAPGFLKDELKNVQ